MTISAGSADDFWSYWWRVFIDAHTPDPAREIDEDAMIGFFANHYAEHPLDDECYIYGVMLYERAFTGAASSRLSNLAKARDVLQAWREITGNRDWDVVEDRLADAVDVLASENP